MDNDQMQALLQHALLDREFGRAVSRDPVSAFATLGIELDPKDVPPEGVKLPTRRAIIEALDDCGGYEPDSKGHIRPWMPCGERDCK